MRKKRNPRKSLGFLLAFVLFTLKHRRKSFSANSNFCAFLDKHRKSFLSPGRKFFMRKIRKPARSLNIKSSFYTKFLTYSINLIFIFVYIKHRKFLLHLTDRNPRYCIWERSGDASLFRRELCHFIDVLFLFPVVSKNILSFLRQTE